MEKVLQNAEKFVLDLLTNELDNNYVYHNLAHTQFVVQNAKEISEAIGLEEKFKNILILACWFHDVGYTVSKENHEEKAIVILKRFAEQEQISNEIFEQVSKLILATRIDVEPSNELEKIIRDADCGHIGSKDYIERSELLRKEWELTQNKKITDKEWFDTNIKFLTTSHRFYTDYALTEWGIRKGKNLARILKNQKKSKTDRIKIQQKRRALEIKKTKVRLPERGIETMFRVAMRNHITLSDIADTKANILLSVNAIIVSMALSNLIPKLDSPSNAHLITPTVIFILFTVASMILSVLATRPNVTEGKFTKEDVANKKVNLIFFGNFHKMSLDDFEWAMGEMMQDRDYLYSSLKKDLYFLGLVLDKKYKILRITYTVFMIGIIISVIAFAISFQMNGVGLLDD